MHHAHFEPLWVAPKAHSIADWLIFLYEIQDGRGFNGHTTFQYNEDLNF